MYRKWNQWSVPMFTALLLGTLGCGGPLPAGKSGMKEYAIAVTDQGSDQIKVYDPKKADWNAKNALQWSWAPTAANGFDGLLSAWGLPTDAKVRKNAKWGGEWMVVTDSKGLAAVIPYPKADRKQWGLDVGGNPHSAELLPNGNIAVAASTGGWVRVYASSQGPAAKQYAEYGLPAAHAVLWDPGMDGLWSAGKDYLVLLQMEGTEAEPVIKEKLKVELPTKNAHAVEPVYGDPDKLWVVTGSKVYQYSKSTGDFKLDYNGDERINRVGVKSISSQGSGTVVETVTDTAKKPPGTCQANNWCTDTVDLFLPDSSRTMTGAELYKARILNPNYQ
ncbi:DUF6528 family protein [Paenibacillus sp. CC-CFT747]|nr:DUF6528 family protein [Paenibacillus sp. CC-CFT747]